jgi:hypothetical protein
MDEQSLPSHKFTITEVSSERYPFQVRCSCNWQCHCHTENEARAQAARHQRLQSYLKASKGMRPAYVR